MKKFFAIATIALTLTLAVSLSACGQTNAASASKTTESTITRTSEVIKALEPVSASAEVNYKKELVSSRMAEIKALSKETKTLRARLHKQRKTMKNPEEIYLDIEAKCVDLRRSIDRLSADSGKLRKVDATDNDKILHRLNHRLELLDDVKANIEALNKKLCIALGDNYDRLPDLQVGAGAWERPYYVRPVPLYVYEEA